MNIARTIVTADIVLVGAGPMAVCDERGRVHGVTGVVVADACLMPQIPRGNTNLPAVMIGERIAQTL